MAPRRRTDAECDCPARVLDDELTGTRCDVCLGIIPPLTDTDEMILRHYNAGHSDRVRAAWDKR